MWCVHGLILYVLLVVVVLSAVAVGSGGTVD